MNLDQKRQEAYYEHYWNVIERNTDYRVSDFIRFWLAARTGKTPVIRKVYSVFRAYAEKYGDEAIADVEPLLKEMLEYSRRYHSCIHPDTGVQGIDQALGGLLLFDASVVYPYLLNLLAYRDDGDISDNDTVEVLRAIDSYLFRRWVCSVPASALDKIFETLHADTLRGVRDGASYVEVVKYLLLHKGGTSRFPSDEELVSALATRDLYYGISKGRKYYLYDRLENGDSKERVAVVQRLRDGTISVEHVMPQTLSAQWKAELGPDWQEIHDTWLHRMANLTIVAYNSSYSTNRRISGFTFQGTRYSATQWNEMETKVLQLLMELQPATIYKLVDGEGFPASSFAATPRDGFTQIAPKAFAKTSSSTVAKIDLLLRVFDECDVEADDLVFQMASGK